MAILGIDEVGRGPWAGPLVVGAVVLGERKIDGLTDSKKLSAKRREVLAGEIYESGAGVGLGWVQANEIDEVGLGEALRLATRRAVEQVRESYHEIIIDGTINLLAGTGVEKYVSVLPKADFLIAEVSAASIVAKVARDKYMTDISEKYPDYGFEKHVGYGTKAHKEALETYGVTPEHRKSFQPIKDMLGIEYKKSIDGGVTAKVIGDRAEESVAEYLRGMGHEIVERNWKTRFCEIDIVSRDAGKLYFTEVKYRKDGRRGGGLEAVTKEKLRRMGFAAESYVKWVKPEKLSPILAVGSVSGEEFTVDEWFVILDK